MSKHIASYFRSLNLKNWIQGRSFKRDKKGGQATILRVFNGQTNVNGIFRALSSPDEQDKQRFKRELKILLADEFKNPYIINILAWPESENDYWYISAEGIPFQEFWSRVTQRSKPDRRVLEAIDLIKKFCQALAPLHRAGVVHRDIKPNNIVVINNVPVLIDFGLVYDPAEERITNKNDAVGNIRFSPDQMMNRMDDIPPYLDVFMLVQLFIWMVKEEPAKRWSRPLDWKWVRYPAGLDTDLLLRIRALTARCSDEYLSPKDATELFQLIENLFSKNAMEKPASSLDEIKRIISTGNAKSSIAFTTDRSSFESHYPSFLVFFMLITENFKQLAMKVEEKDMPIDIVFNLVPGFAEYVRSFTRYDDWIEHQAHVAKCGTEPGLVFYVKLGVVFNPPSVSKPWISNEVGPVLLKVSRTSQHRNGANRSFHIGMKKNGDLVQIRLGETNYVQRNLETAWNSIEELITDKQVWELHQIPLNEL